MIKAINQFECAELAIRIAVTTTDAQNLIHLRDVPRRRQHRHAVALGLHGAAAALAAVADSIETVEHCILEEGMMDVPALVLGAQDLDGFIARDPARPLRLMFVDETGKGIAHNKADVHGLAWMLARGAAGALEHDDTVRVLHDDGARALVRDHLFQVMLMWSCGSSPFLLRVASLSNQPAT